MIAVYALHRAMYADDEAEYLARPANYREAVEARRRLAAAEIALSAQISTLLRVGSSAAVHAVEVAVGLIERLPTVFALIGENVISPKAAELALGRSRVLSADQVREFDAALHDRLTVEYEVLSIPALRDEVDLLVSAIDPEAAERRRRLAEQDRRVTFRPAEDGMAMAFALLPAPDMQEMSARIGYIAGTVCEEDPRTQAQREADGMAQLIRGYGTLGCTCEKAECRYREARYHGEPDADGVVTRFITLLTVVVNDKDLAQTRADAPTDDVDGAEAPAPSPSQGGGRAYLMGHGQISDALARALASREDTVIRPFGRRITDEDGAGASVFDTARTVLSDSDGERDRDEEGVARGTIDVDRVWTMLVAQLEGHDGPDDPGFGGALGGDGPDGDGPRDDGPRDDGPDDGPVGDGPELDGPDDHGPDGNEPSGGPDGRAPDSGASRSTGTTTVTGTTTKTDTDSASSGPPVALVRARGSSGYRPSTDLRRYLRMIHPRCVFPHCGRPASRAQIDHRREYDHLAPELGGGTTADQLQPLCVAHHQLKTAGEWIDARLPDGRILWTSPDGRRYIVDPTGVMLRLFPDLARVEWVIPARTPPGSAAQPGGRTRLQREHARREELRRRNVAALQADQARTVERPSAIEAGIARALGTPPQTTASAFDGPPPF